MELLFCETDEYVAASAVEVKSSEASSTSVPGSSKAVAPSSPSDALVLKLVAATKIRAVKIKKSLVFNKWFLFVILIPFFYIPSVSAVNMNLSTIDILIGFFFQ